MKKGMVTYTVKLRDGTVGYVTSANEPKLGYEMPVTLRDETGNVTTATGIVDEILEAKAPWM
jgi:hypothetical protein